MRNHPTILYPSSQGELVVDSLALTPGTFTQVVGLGLLFSALLAGVFAAGAIF